MIFLWILLAVIFVSLLSLLGLVLISLKDKTLHSLIHLLVSFAAGSMIGSAFLHILPESVGTLSGLTPFLIVILGIVLFFVIEKVLHWRHCHDEHCKIHPVAYLNLFGDGVHNFMDGVAISAAFLISVDLGITTTIAIVMHEIPHELGNFAILISSGLTKTKALFYNFLSAIFSILGAILTYVFATYVNSIIIYIMPIIAGGFIYMAGTDIFPELHKEKRLSKSSLQFLFIILGILLMWIMKLVLNVV